ncbi:ParB/RepB/Spo0J family partition protein [Actinosynnema sp. NPDC091369]
MKINLSSTGVAHLTAVEKVDSVSIDSVTVTDSPRLAGLNTDHVRALADAEGALLPIVVHRETMRVVDGAHRLAAARLRGQQEIEVVFVSGSECDLFVLSVQANIGHGLTLTLAERKAAANRILISHPHWSDRKIAMVTGMSPSTVGSLRNRSSVELGHSNKRRGLDGVERPQSTAESRSRAYALLTERPNASVREIAAIVGLAPSTVHDVRQRMRDGRAPVPTGQRGAAEPVRRLHVAGGRADRSAEDGAGISVATLSVDPALRHSDLGRLLLRLLSTQTLLEQRLTELTAIVPRHLVGSVATLARRTGDTWYSFSDQVGLVDRRSRG